MKTNLTLAISVVLSLSVLMAQLEDPSGRWLFRAVTDTGEQIPLLIVKVSSGGEAAEAAILSTSAPFDIRVQDIQMDSQSFQMILAAEEGPLTLRGTPRDGSLVGTIQGFAFDNHRFRADRTDLSELQKLPEPSQAELQDYGHSLRRHRTRRACGRAERVSPEPPGFTLEGPGVGKYFRQPDRDH